MAKPVDSTCSVGRRKVMGMHYTPAVLGRFVADRLVRRIDSPADQPLRILDPASGDGALLEAILVSLAEAGFRRCDVVAVEAAEDALGASRARLAPFRWAGKQFVLGDFLDLTMGQRRQGNLWQTCGSDRHVDQPFDIVIANPPYVRTQVLGANRSRQLAARFELTGRIDLYHAFLVAATEVLKPGGQMGVITSNRFLTTLGGAAVRRYLAHQYEIDEVIDLGDTKLFEAAVLPAVFLGRRRAAAVRGHGPQQVRFIKVYSQTDSAARGPEKPAPGASIVDILMRGKTGIYRVPEGVYELTCGDVLLASDAAQVWSLTTAKEAQWVERLRAHSHALFGDVAAVRVGIKTTADSVFIRSDWDSLPTTLRPEPELLRPLLRHGDARRWSLSRGMEPAAHVLYPHEVYDGRRRAIPLSRYPKARAYLESHRDPLERRHYVTEAGRRWYEIWVPQDPAAWVLPKIVFPDISPEPRFFLDTDGRLVDGDCYWITLRPHVPPEMIYLLLGVANSRVMSRYHDLVFNNRLYSARRRYITQYVAKYPTPSLAAPASQALIKLVRRITDNHALNRGGAGADAAEEEVDALVTEAFGLPPGEVTG